MRREQRTVGFGRVGLKDEASTGDAGFVADSGPRSQALDGPGGRGRLVVAGTSKRVAEVVGYTTISIEGDVRGDCVALRRGSDWSVVGTRRQSDGERHGDRSEPNWHRFGSIAPVRTPRHRRWLPPASASCDHHVADHVTGPSNSRDRP